MKQNYERLTSILKNTEDGSEKNIEDILIDYSKILNKLNSVKNDLSQKESSLKDNLNTIMKLETEKEELNNVIESQKKTSNDFMEKYQDCKQKLSRMKTLEAQFKTLEKENQSLQDQNTVLKKTNSEQLKSLSLAPVEMMTTINSLKSNVKKKDIEIKELKGQNIRLEQLVDEARDAIRQNKEDISREIEKSTFEDALTILDDIISQPLISSSTQRDKEFLCILKKIQHIRDQIEEPLVYKVMAIIKQHIDMDFSEQEEQCKNLNDYKIILAKMFGWYRDNQKTSLVNYDDSELLNVSTDSKSIRKPYRYKESCVDISSTFDQYIGFIEHIHNIEIDKAKQQIATTLTEKHEKYVEICTNEIYQKFEQERSEMSEKFKLEKDKEVKQLENKIKKDYDEKRVKMYEEFEILKSQFSEQFSQQTNEYQNLTNQDLQKQKEELEKQKEQYEIKYEEKVQRKTQLLEGIFTKRQTELEDEFSLKKQKLEFDMKNITESQDSKYKADIEKMISKFETQSQEKVKRIESETQDQI